MDDVTEEFEDFPGGDPVAELVTALTPLAREAKDHQSGPVYDRLLEGMDLLLRAATPMVRQGELYSINGGKTDGEVQQ